MKITTGNTKVDTGLEKGEIGVEDAVAVVTLEAMVAEGSTLPDGFMDTIARIQEKSKGPLKTLFATG